MKARQLWVGVAFCAATVLGTSSVYSQTKDEKKPEAAKPASNAPPAVKRDPAATPAPAQPVAPKPAEKPAAAGNEMESMMKAMSEMSGPGKEHDALKPLIGTFTCANKFTMAPGAPPMESTGTVTRKWVLGNRYIEEEVKGNMGGVAFEGFGLAGYDKMQKLYHSYWIDNMGTGWWLTTGTADAAGKVFSFTGENFDPMAGMKKKGKTTMDLTDANKQVMKMFDIQPDGKEVLSFEMTCTRK